MPEIRICFEVDFECFDLGFIHAGQVLPIPVWSPWLIVIQFVAEWILPATAAIFLIRDANLSLAIRWLAVGVLMLPATRFLCRGTIRLFSIDSRLATSDCRFEISVRPDGWTLSTANTRAEHRWALVARVVRFDTGFVVVENWAGQSARWLPLTGFESAAAADEFVGLVRGAAVAFEDRRART